MLKNKNIKKILPLIGFMMCCIITNSYAQQKLYNTTNDLIKYIKLPAGITKADVLLGKKETKTALYNFSKSILKNLKTDSLSRKMDLIVVFTDKDGTPILPDKENRNKQITVANSNLNNELT